MKKKVLIALLLLISLLFLLVSPSTILAQGDELTSLSESDITFDEDEGVTADFLQQVNPLVQEGDPALAEELSRPGGVISRGLQFAFPIAGLILFVMLVWGGFEMMIGAATKKTIDQGRKRVTYAVIGFLLLFASYWIVQVIEAVFGIAILGG